MSDTQARAAYFAWLGSDAHGPDGKPFDLLDSMEILRWHAVAKAVIAADQEDQAARQAAMARVIDAVAWFFAPFDPVVDDGMTHRFVNLEDRWNEYKALLDATEQEAR